MEKRVTIFGKAQEIPDLDFTNPTGDVLLPSLMPNVTKYSVIPNKNTLIKRSVFEKNKKNHKELAIQESRNVLSLALTETNLVINDKPKGKPNYWILVHVNKDDNAIVTIDVDPQKQNIEVVGWRKVRDRSVNQIKNRAIREGGQILITQGVAAGLSALTDSSVFNGKDNKIFENTSE